MEWAPKSVSSSARMQAASIVKDSWVSIKWGALWRREKTTYSKINCIDEQRVLKRLHTSRMCISHVYTTHPTRVTLPVGAHACSHTSCAHTPTLTLSTHYRGRVLLNHYYHTHTALSKICAQDLLRVNPDPDVSRSWASSDLGRCCFCKIVV